MTSNRPIVGSATHMKKHRPQAGVRQFRLHRAAVEDPQRGRDEGAPPLRRDEEPGGGSRPVVATVEGGGGAETPLLYCALRVFYQL